MLKGFICPDSGEKPGRKNELDYCLNKCKKPCVAPHVLSALYEAEVSNPHKDKIISVTMLTGGCKRKTMLERNIDYYTVPDRKLPTFRGGLIHSLVQGAAANTLLEKDWLIEKKMTLPVSTASGDWVLSGTLDGYHKRLHTLWDIKTLRQYAVEKLVMGKEGGQWSEHIPDQYVLQPNIYAYMGRKLKLFKAKRLRLQIIDFGQLIATGGKATIRVRKGKFWEEQEFDIPDIPILSDEVIESYINSEGDEWYRILYEENPAPVCSEEDSWLCKVCVFNGTRYCPSPKEERKLNV